MSASCPSSQTEILSCVNNKNWATISELSCLCRSAAKFGKTVLHLDSANYYGSEWTSFQLNQFLDWCNSQKATATVTNASSTQTDASSTALPGLSVAQPEKQPTVTSSGTQPLPASSEQGSGAYDRKASVPEPHASAQSDLHPSSATASDQALQQAFVQVPVGRGEGSYTNLEIDRAEGAELGPSREYNIDLAPRVRLHMSDHSFCTPYLLNVIVRCSSASTCMCYRTHHRCLFYHSVHLTVEKSAMQVVHCAGSLINALLDAGAQHYLEFKLLQQR